MEDRVDSSSSQSSPQSNEDSMSNLPLSPTSSDESSPRRTPTCGQGETNPPSPAGNEALSPQKNPMYIMDAIETSSSNPNGQMHKGPILKLEAKDDSSPALHTGDGIFTSVESKSHPNHIDSSLLPTSTFVTSQPSSSQHLPQSALLLPPYTTNIKGGESQGPEGISLSNYVKLMTLQSGGNVGYGMLHQSQQGAFYPTGSPCQTPPSTDLLSVVTPATLPPQYPDMGYPAQQLIANQTQHLNTLAGFLTKASNPTPGAVTSPHEEGFMKLPPSPFQPDYNRLHSQQTGSSSNSVSSFRTSNEDQTKRRSVKRALDQSYDHGETGGDSGIEVSLTDNPSSHGSMFPPDSGGGSRDDGGRNQVADYIMNPLSLSGSGHNHLLKWQAHMVNTWNDICDASLIDIPPMGFCVDTDKGFNFSVLDDSFVCQKKNHFQVTVSVLFHRTPKFVKMKNGSIQPIERFHLKLNGVKFEQVNSHIQLEQSRSDRSRIKYKPEIIEIPENPEKTIKRTICRLHFSETTQNNMRKRGKPNPDQKHFSLVVALDAETPEGLFPVVVHVSERIVVRASNPGNFDNDNEHLWYKSSSLDTIFHHGRVGINTEQADEALTVNGNVQVTGQILQVSDCRVKKNIQPVREHNHLDNISKLQLYRYQLDEGVYMNGSTKDLGRGGVAKSQAASERHMGLLAQEVRQILPQAVRETDTEMSLGSGERITNILMVDKDQILMETIGAVQELKENYNMLNLHLSSLRTSNCRQYCNCQNGGTLSPTSTSHNTPSRNDVLYFYLVLAVVCNLLLTYLYVL